VAALGISAFGSFFCRALFRKPSASRFFAKERRRRLDFGPVAKAALLFLGFGLILALARAPSQGSAMIGLVLLALNRLSRSGVGRRAIWSLSHAASRWFSDRRGSRWDCLESAKAADAEGNDDKARS